MENLENVLFERKQNKKKIVKEYRETNQNDSN